MSIVLAIVTATDLIHVSDLPAEGPRTLLLRHSPIATGLITTIGEAPPLSWVQAEAAEPRHEALALAQHLSDRAGIELDAEIPRGVLMTGWGKDRAGRDHTFRYLVSNLGEADGFRLEGESITPDRVLRKHAAPAYSVQVVMTDEQSASLRRRLDALPKAVRKGDMSAVALDAAAIVREVVPGPVLLVHLTPDGEIEAAILDGATVQGLEPAAARGTTALRPA